LIKGVFKKTRFIDLIQHFIVFEDDGAAVTKKMAGYHQFHAVKKAVQCTIQASSPSGDKRVGVIWHTQGSGKSLSMVFYAGKIVNVPEMANPTIVVITDRNDLDDQLFGTFARCKDLLRQTPVQAENREELRELLRVASGGVVFTTIQKFLPDAKGEHYPILSTRRNIIVIADEAHRSQYAFIEGLARNLRDGLPNASFIGFTGTPIELSDRSTPAVFGDYIDVYDIQRAVEDGATVRIYYESRLAKIELDAQEKPKLDASFEEVTEGEEQNRREKLKTKWAALEALVGAEKRINLLAKDIIDHFEKRLGAMEGKAMLVCMSWRICVALYDAITKLRPQWHSDDDETGDIKVVMTGSAADDVSWQPHIRNKARREFLARRFKDPLSSLKLVIVRDMWLTGFDCPSMHTMHVDKPMRSHGLMQAIARVNRVFKDKPGGLVVDYLGLADQLREAVRDYTEGGGQGDATFDQDQAADVLEEKFEVCCSLFHGFDYTKWRNGTAAERLALLPPAQEFILAQQDGKKRCLQAVTELSKAFALAVPHPRAIAIREDVGFSRPCEQPWQRPP
jgi:type I restriction enzyme R subunit